MTVVVPVINDPVVYGMLTVWLVDLMITWEQLRLANTRRIITLCLVILC